MFRFWIGTALLAGSWLLGLNYFYPVNLWAWAAALVAGVVLLGNTANVALPLGGKPRSLEVAALILLLPAVWFAAWPYRAAPLLVALGLAIRLLPIGRPWSERLSCGAIAAGVVLFVQALTLELYVNQTARSHALPGPLPDMLATMAGLLGIDATADGSSVVMHSMRQVHRLAATWELLFDPATFLFFIGGLTMLALRSANDECPINPAPAQSTGPSSVIRRPFSSWLRSARWFALVVLAWLPLRAGLLIAVYLHRVLRSDPARPLHAMNHFFSPWTLLVLLLAPVLLAWRFVRIDDAGRGTGDGGRETGEEPAEPLAPAPTQGGREPNDEGLPIHPSSFILHPSPLLLPAALVALAVALFTAAIYWNPIGARRDGRVMVVERHSEWSPTTKPYDTTWFAEPKLFGEASGYNYAAVYDYLGQFYRMSRLLEDDKIDDQTLGKCDVLVIKIPTHRYSQGEAEAVTRFVERGGGLLLIGDHTNFENSATAMNDVTRPMGFIFRDDLLFGFTDPYAESYARPAVPHPGVQRVPRFDWAVSCSVNPGSSRGRPIITSIGLWSMGPEYHNDNYHPVPQHCPEMRYGAFVQAWAAWHGQGRAIAFTDSTIFSNFCVFQPGKAEIMLNMIEWLNHGNPPLDPRPWLLLLGLLPLAAGLWMGFGLPSPFGRGAGGEGGTEVTDALTLTLSQRERGRPNIGVWLVLLAAGTCGWVAASVAVTAAHRAAMPLPQRVRPEPCVVIDRSTSTVPLGEGMYTTGDGDGYGLLESWIARLGCYTTRKEGSEAFSGDALVVICPSRSVPDEFREGLKQYVERGGKLLVIDSPENAGSTAYSVLWPFGLSIHHDRAWQGKLSTTAELPRVNVANANEVAGGQPIATLDKLPVAAAAKFGKGSVLAVGFGSLWNDRGMGENWMTEPNDVERARYDLLFGLVRSLLEDKVAPTSAPPGEKGPAEMGPEEPGPRETSPKPKDSGVKESGPAEM